MTLWNAIQQYFVTLPPLHTSEHLDIETQRQLLLLWEATNDHHALYCCGILGLPWWIDNGQLAQCLFDDLLLLRSFPVPSTSEQRPSTSATSMPSPTGSCEECSGGTRRNASSEETTSGTSLPAALHPSRLDSDAAAVANPPTTGFWIAPSTFAQLVTSVSQVIEQANVSPTSSREGLGGRQLLERTGTAVPQTPTVRRIPRHSNLRGEANSTRSSNA